jgi:hypothetical protein
MQTKTLAIKQRHLPLVMFILLACGAMQTLTAHSRGLVVTTKDGTTLTSFARSYALVIGESAYRRLASSARRQG